MAPPSHIRQEKQLSWNSVIFHASSLAIENIRIHKEQTDQNANYQTAIFKDCCSVLCLSVALCFMGFATFPKM